MQYIALSRSSCSAKTSEPACSQLDDRRRVNWRINCPDETEPVVLCFRLDYPASRPFSTSVAMVSHSSVWRELSTAIPSTHLIGYQLIARPTRSFQLSVLCPGSETLAISVAYQDQPTWLIDPFAATSTDPAAILKGIHRLAGSCLRKPTSPTSVAGEPDYGHQARRTDSSIRTIKDHR